MKNFLFLFLGIFCFEGIYAQNEGVIIESDPRLELLVQKHDNGRVQCYPLIAGYRIILKTESSKKKIEEARQSFIQNYPEIATYVLYDSPKYYLKAGNFEWKEDADILKEQLVSKFPEAVVVKEMIYLFETY